EVAALGILDLNHLRAEAGQQQGGIGAGKGAGEVDHPQALQRAGLGGDAAIHVSSFRSAAMRASSNPISSRMTRLSAPGGDAARVVGFSRRTGQPIWRSTPRGPAS